MKALLKALEFVGIMLLLAGGGAMDSTSIAIPIMMAFIGLWMFVASAMMEGKIYG